MAAVAAKAGVATGSVYRHFPGKADLVAEVFRQVVSREVAAVEQAATGTGTVTEQVVAVFETFAGRALKAPRLAYALLAEPVDAPVEEQRLVFRRAFRDVIARRITDGVAAGLLPSQNAEITAAALVGAAAEVLIGPLTAGDTDSISELFTFTVRALGGSDASDS